MQQETLTAHLGQAVTVDLCQACQSFWFDARESVRLSPAATLTLFRLIGELAARPQLSNTDLAKCPRCQARLRRTHDRQRATRFVYWRCPDEHGRLTSFFDFLREKDFIRPLTQEQVAELRRNIQSVNCSNCGAPVHLATAAVCAHCGTALSMLDLSQAEQLVRQLRRAADRTTHAIDPSLPLELARARREVEAAFAGVPDDRGWFDTVSSAGLVSAGLSVAAKWLKARA
jgi:hypothetical protein